MVLDNLWSIAGYFRSLRDSRPTANEMGKLVFYFGLAREGQEFVPTKTTAEVRAIESDARMRHTKLTVPGFRQRIDPRAPEVFLSAS